MRASPTVAPSNSSSSTSAGQQQQQQKPLLTQSLGGNDSSSGGNATTTTTSSSSPEEKSKAPRIMSSFGIILLLSTRWSSWISSWCSIKWLVLFILCFQNSMFTLLRRYSQGILKESYSKYEVLLAGEVMKILFSIFMIQRGLVKDDIKDGDNTKSNNNNENNNNNANHQVQQQQQQLLRNRLWYLVWNSHKMMILALIYGAMNILSFISLRNIGAGMFTIFAQCKILTTATFSTLLLQRQYSSTQWRALIGLMFGVLLFSEPIWNTATAFSTTSATQEEAGATGSTSSAERPNPFLGTVAVLAEVTLSGFASIYFEKVIKLDTLKLSIWERNFQLALTSFPVYMVFILHDTSASNTGGFGTGWSLLTWTVAIFGAAGGLLVALSIKYGDAILKTLATTGAIVLSSVLDHVILDGPLTATMMIAGVQVILSIFNYTFDMTPPSASLQSQTTTTTTTTTNNTTTSNHSDAKASLSKSSLELETIAMERIGDEEVGLLKRSSGS